MAISPILLTLPMVWTKAVSWHQSFSTCSSPVSSTTLCSVLTREYISTAASLVPYSTFTDSQVSERNWLISSRWHCLLITVHSWHTSPVTCKPCWTGSQMPQSHLAWLLALQRPKLFSNQYPTAAPLSPPSPLMAWSWRLSKASSTLEAWSQTMENSTGKSLWGSAKQVKLFEHSVTGCSHTTMCP